MNALNNLLDKARKTCVRDSDAALAEKIGVARNSVSVWRKGGKITEEHLAALVELAKAEPAIAVQIMAEQARTKQEKSVWSALARQLGVAATVAVAALITGWMPLPAQARTLTTAQAEQPATVCIMRSRQAVPPGALGPSSAPAPEPNQVHLLRAAN